MCKKRKENLKILTSVYCPPLNTYMVKGEESSEVLYGRHSLFRFEMLEFGIQEDG